MTNKEKFKAGIPYALNGGVYRFCRSNYSIDRLDAAYPEHACSISSIEQEHVNCYTVCAGQIATFKIKFSELKFKQS